MLELNKHEVQSPELQEVMSKIPGNFIKWGLFMFFTIILSLLVGSYFIKSPDIVTVPVKITTRNPPIILVPKTGGEIENLFVKEGSKIKRGEIIAIIGNASEYEDVNTVTRFLTSLDNRLDWIVIVKSSQPPSNLSLGELQSDYSRFQKEWNQLHNYLSQAYIQTKLDLLEKQLEKKIEYNLLLTEQKKHLTQDLALEIKRFKRDSILYSDYRSSITVQEFERSQQTLIQKLYSYSVFTGSLINQEADFLKMKETRIDLQIQYQKEIEQYILSIEESFQLLKSSMAQWEERYIIKSPIAGNVTLTSIRNDNQVIKAGETLATIIPDDPTSIIVRATIPSSGFGKIEVGQTVNIKLSGFPFMQYGVLKGKVFSVSQVPGEGGFYADIELVEGMTSTYREKIKFIHEMEGSGDIITKDVRLINRVLNPIKDLVLN